MPVQSSNDAAPWATSTSRPSIDTCARARARPRARSRVSGYGKSISVCPAGRHEEHLVPHRRGVDDEVGVATRRAASRPRREKTRASGECRAERGCAAPPAPIGRPAASAASPASDCRIGGGADHPAVADDERVHGARRRPRRRLRRPRPCGERSRSRRRSRVPRARARPPRRARPRRAAAGTPSRARVRRRRRSASRGESEYSTGSPSRPTSRVRPEIIRTRARPCTPRSRRSST